MITFEKISFRNALSWLQGDIQLADQGLVLICGENRDASRNQGSSNGAGKSSIFELLTHVFYHQTSKGIKLEAVVNAMVNEDCEIAVDFSVGSKKCRIEQFQASRKHGNKTFIKEDNKSVTPHTRTDAKKYIPDLLGLSLEEFLGVIYLSQGSIHTLIEGTGGLRMDYIGRLFQLYRYDRLVEELKNIRDTMSPRINVLEVAAIKARHINDRLANIPKTTHLAEQIDLIEKGIQQAASQKHDWSRHVIDLRMLIEQLKERECIESQGASADAAEQLIRKEQRKATLDSSIAAMEQMRTQTVERKSLVAKLGDLNDIDLTEITSELAASRAIKEELPRKITKANERARLEQAVRSAIVEASFDACDSTTLTNLEQTVEKLTKELAGSRTDLKRDKETLQNLSAIDSTTCPTCLQSVSPEYLGPQRTHYQDHVSQLEKDVAIAKSNLDQLKQDLGIARQVNSWQNQMLGLPAESPLELQQQFSSLERRIKELSEQSSVAKDIHLIKSRLEVLPNEEVSTIDEDLTLLRKKITILQDAIHRLNAEKSRHDLLQRLPAGSISSCNDDLQRVESLLREIESLLHEAAQISAAQKSSLEERTRLEDELTPLETDLSELKSLQHKHYLCQELIRAIGVLKQKRTRGILSAIQSILPAYTQMMFSEPGLSFMLADDLEENSIDILVKRYTKVKGKLIPHTFPIKRLSGGEKKRLGVALLFTLQRVLSPGKQSNILVLDEADTGLDTLGREAFIQAVRSLTGYSSVFVITQTPEMAEDHYFDQTWTIIKENGTSRLKINRPAIL